MNPLEYVLNLGISWIGGMIPATKPSLKTLKNAKIIAHRGVHEQGLATENTLKSFDLALQNKIWGIELDVRMTCDNVPVVHHDPDTQRVFPDTHLTISKTTQKDLADLAPDIPTLARVVAAYGKRLHLMLEIKEDYRHRPEAVAAIVQTIKDISPNHDYHLMSLIPEYLEAFSHVPVSAKVDIIWINPMAIFKKNYDLNHGGVAGHFLFFSSDRIKKMHALSKMVGVGFLDSKNSLYRELNRGADWVFTNHPIRLRNWLPD